MSKGNFMDFVEEASANAQLREQVLNELYRESATPEDIMRVLHQSGYEGVSLDDCRKLVRFAGQKDLRTSSNFDVKY